MIHACPANCSVSHDYQDKKYGPNMRVFNETRNGKLNCTVCGIQMNMPGGSGKAAATNNSSGKGKQKKK